MRDSVIALDTHTPRKVIDIIGLYKAPPVDTIVLSVDEKTQIQPLDHTQPLLQLAPHQVERHTHDYVRHGTTSLYAAFDIATGRVIGRTNQRRRAKEVREWLAAHPQYHFHFTPTSSSWLNAMGNWFSRLERRGLQRKVFQSVKE